MLFHSFKRHILLPLIRLAKVATTLSSKEELLETFSAPCRPIRFFMQHSPNNFHFVMNLDLLQVWFGDEPGELDLMPHLAWEQNLFSFSRMPNFIWCQAWFVITDIVVLSHWLTLSLCYSDYLHLLPFSSDHLISFIFCFINSTCLFSPRLPFPSLQLMYF